MSKIGFQDAGFGGFFWGGDFQSARFHFFFVFFFFFFFFCFHQHIELLLHHKFQLNSPNGGARCGCGDRLGFLIDTILAHFDQEIVLLLQLKSTKGLRRDVEN